MSNLFWHILGMATIYIPDECKLKLQSAADKLGLSPPKLLAQLIERASENALGWWVTTYDGLVQKRFVDREQARQEAATNAFVPENGRKKELYGFFRCDAEPEIGAQIPETAQAEDWKQRV